jgi:hypothetical protein
VNRLAYDNELGGRDRLVYMLCRGAEFGGWEAGGLHTGQDERGKAVQPFAVIGVAREVHIIAISPCLAPRLLL